MKPKIEFDGAMKSILMDMSELNKLADAGKKKALNEIGKVVKEAVEASAPRSDVNYSKKGGAHIQDDVVYAVKKSKTKEDYVTISGGKKTWRKWHLVNDGHVAQNGRFVTGAKFIEKAIGKSEARVEAVINNYLGDIVNGKGN